MPILFPFMLMPFLGIYGVAKTKYNRYTLLAVIGLLLLFYAFTSGANVIATVYSQSIAQKSDYAETNIIESTLMETITGRRFLGLAAILVGLGLCWPWYKKYRDYALNNRITLDKLNLAIAYFVFSSTVCGLFWLL
jgi:hypothetical protein